MQQCGFVNMQKLMQRCESEINEIEDPLVDRMVNLKIWNRNSMVIW